MTSADLIAFEADLLSLLKGEHSSLHITFNDHAADYMTAAEQDARECLDHGDWVSDEEKAKALASNRVWIVQWYPSTPNGFHAVKASSLRAAVEAALKNDG